jgi:charged multivesicular body protein 4
MDLFFRKSKPAPAKEAIVKLHETSQFLDKREAHLQLKIESELKVARANASKNKRGNLTNCKFL